jgi:rsbT co-antagonist protein RsbR
MLTTLLTIAMVSFGSVLGTLVATRAIQPRLRALFVLVVALVVLLNALSGLQSQARDAESGYLLGAISATGVAALSLALLLLLSTLFMPQWWQGKRPIIWIALPYALATLAIAADALARTRLIIDGARLVGEVYRLTGARPGGPILLALFSLGWVIQVAMLASAFAQVREQRRAVGTLAAAIGLTIVSGLLTSQFDLPAIVSLVCQTVPLLAALAYAVLRTSLLAPTGIALDLTVQTIGDAVAVLRPSGAIAYVNPAAARFGMAVGRSLGDALRAAGVDEQDLARLTEERATARVITLLGRRLEAARTPVTDVRGRRVGWLFVGRDITEAARRQAQLEEERERLAETVRQLEEERRERAQLGEVVRQLSVPVIPVLNGVLVAPLVGDLDEQRAEALGAAVLRGVERERARAVVLDITGVPLLDAQGAASLARAVRAAGLLGARCVLVGVRPEIAEALVAAGADLGVLQAAATLREALATEFASARG